MEQPAGRQGRALLIHLPAVQASRRHLTAQQVKEGGQRQAELCFHPQSSCKHQDLQRLLTSRHCQLSFGQRNGRPACQEGDTQGPEQLSGSCAVPKPKQRLLQNKNPVENPALNSHHANPLWYHCKQNSPCLSQRGSPQQGLKHLLLQALHPCRGTRSPRPPEKQQCPYLDAEALGLDEGQCYVLVVLPGFTDQVHFLTEVLLKVFLCGRVHHCGFYL